MKPLHVLEIKSISKELESLLDAKMQKFFATARGIGLELRKANETSYLWFDLDPTNPLILLFQRIPQSFKLLKTSPLILFAKAHLEQKRLSEITHKEELGRVLELDFGYEDPVRLEVRLFPHGANVIIHSAGKRISFDKIKEIKAAESTTTPDVIRTLEQVTTEWSSKKIQKNKQEVNPELLKEKEIQKKEKALLKTQEHLIELQNDKWQKLGEWLKENQTLKVPEEFKDIIDSKKSFSQNIQISFEKAKKNQEKISGTKERIQILESEIAKIKLQEASAFVKSAQGSNKKQKEDGWTGYRLSLNEKVEVFVGKNAQENMTILKHAQSWDYWMHIKDYPGAHGIVRRPRQLEVSDEDLRKVAQFIASKSRKSAHFLGPGDGFDVLIAECRYVKPIKGDKLGRVSYSNERVLHCKMPTR